MDAFYASVEQKDNAAYRGKPLVVGGKSERSVVAAASYEARKFGVRSAMSTKIALQKCPKLIIVKPRFDRYKEISKTIRNIFLQYTDLVEPLSLDEAFLDVSENKIDEHIATVVARKIKRDIYNETGLTASAGISNNKFLAKIASDMNKPNGLYVIKPEFALSFIAELSIDKFFGVGKATAAKMRQLGIINGKDLRKFDHASLVRLFGKAGDYYYNIARGIDDRPVNPNRKRKSVGVERTFENDIARSKDIYQALNKIEEELWFRLSRNNFWGKTLTLKIKYADFVQVTRSYTDAGIFNNRIKIHENTLNLLQQISDIYKGIRLMGLTISNLPDDQGLPVQLQINFKDASGNTFNFKPAGSSGFQNH